MCALGIIKHNVADARRGFVSPWRTAAGCCPRAIIAGTVRDVWAVLFTLHNVKTSLASAGVSPLDTDPDINRLNARGTKRRAQPFHHTLLADIRLLVADEKISYGLRKILEHHLLSVRLDRLWFLGATFIPLCCLTEQNL